MKKIIFFILLVLNSSLFAQKKDRGFLLAQELFDSEQYYKAMYAFQEVKTHDDFEENFKNRHLAVIYEKLKNIDQALPYLQKLNSEDKEYLLGKAYYKSDSISLAIELLNTALTKDTSNADLYYFLAKSYFKNKDYSNAIVNYLKAKEKGIDEVKLEMYLGISRYFLEDYLKAIVNLEYAKIYYHFNKQLNNYLGMSYYKVARKDLAIKTLKEAISFGDKSTAESAINLALIFEDLNQSDSVIYYLKTAIKIDKDRVDAYYFLGNKFYDLKKYNQSQYYYEELLKINPNYQQAYNSLANSYFLDKNYDKAIEKYRQSTFLKDQPTKELNYIGICYLQSNNINKAKVYFEEALKKDPSFYIAYVNLANLSFHEQNYNAAISFLNYASQYKKDDADINFLFAKIYLQIERLGDAEHFFKETIRFNPLKKQAYFYLGHLYLIKNNPQRANFYYDILLTFSPNHQEGNLYRGIASFLTKEYDNASIYLQKAYQLAPNDYKTKYQYCKALVKNKQELMAYPLLKELNAEKPTDNRVYYMLYKTVKKLKKKDEVKYYKSIIKKIEQ